MFRSYNFSAGPSMLPQSIIKKAIKEMPDYRRTGISVIEMTCRSKAYAELLSYDEGLVRRLMNIPENYKVLFLHGGASKQFAMIPMNLMSKNKKADYINTGIWSQKAIAEARLVGDVNIIASSGDKKFTYIPDNYSLSPDADYVHITSNNTMEGTRFTKLPDTGSIPLVADMSSNILSEEIDVSKYGLIYAGAQKNLGPAGVSIIIIREDLLDRHDGNIPKAMQYGMYLKNKSLYSILPFYNLYILSLILEWIEEIGGIKNMESLNNRKAYLLYKYLDESQLFKSPVNKQDRSIMNIPFVLVNDRLNSKFVTEAAEQGLCMLQGHRSVGGMRASLYNTMPVKAVKRLVEFMREFEKNNRNV